MINTCRHTKFVHRIWWIHIQKHDNWASWTCEFTYVCWVCCEMVSPRNTMCISTRIMNYDTMTRYSSILYSIWLCCWNSVISKSMLNWVYFSLLLRQQIQTTHLYIPIRSADSHHYKIQVIFLHKKHTSDVCPVALTAVNSALVSAASQCWKKPSPWQQSTKPLVLMNWGYIYVLRCSIAGCPHLTPDVWPRNHQLPLTLSWQLGFGPNLGPNSS